MAIGRSGSPESQIDAATAAAAVLESRESPRVGADFPVELHGPAFDSRFRPRYGISVRAESALPRHPGWRWTLCGA